MAPAVCLGRSQNATVRASSVTRGQRRNAAHARDNDAPVAAVVSPTTDNAMLGSILCHADANQSVLLSTSLSAP